MQVGDWIRESAVWMDKFKDKNELMMTQDFGELMDSLAESRNHSIRWTGESWKYRCSHE